MNVPWLPSELWSEIELRKFGDGLTWLGMKNRAWAVKQWAEVMLNAPLSEELMVDIRAARFDSLMDGVGRSRFFEEVI